MASEIKVDTISEKTSANGVSIDGLSIKDGVITAGNPIKEADMWRRNAEEDLSSNAVLANHWERADTDGATYIGTGLTESSGVFTFPSTGIYHIHYHFMFKATGEAGFGVALQTTLDNGTYSDAADSREYTPNVANMYASASGSFIFDVTSTSTHKFRFNGFVITGSAPNCIGSTDCQKSGFTVIRLGDT